MGPRKNVPLILDKSLKFEPVTGLRPFIESAPVAVVQGK